MKKNDHICIRRSAARRRSLLRTGASDLRRRPLRLLHGEIRRDRAFSFKTTPGEDTRTIRLAVETVTRTTDRTMSYRLGDRPREDHGTSAEAYDLDPNPVIQAGCSPARLHVTVHARRSWTRRRSTRCAHRRGRDFLPGPTTNCLRIIRVSNIISQPDWWNQDSADAFLGTYSNKKYEEFIKATGVSDPRRWTTAKFRPCAANSSTTCANSATWATKSSMKTAARCSTESISTLNSNAAHEKIRQTSDSTRRRLSGHGLLRGQGQLRLLHDGRRHPRLPQWTR